MTVPRVRISPSPPLIEWLNLFERKGPVMSAVKAIIIIVAYLSIIYTYPRFLVSVFGMESPWTNYFYMYGFGLLFFGTGLYVIVRSGSCQLGRGRDSFWFKFMIFGYCFLASLHASWIALALSFPFLGGE